MKLWSPVVSAKAWIFSCGTSIHDDGPELGAYLDCCHESNLRDLRGAAT